MSFKRTAISLSILGLIAATPAFAEGENPKFEKAKATAQAATDAGDWKRAETNWAKALTALEAQGEATPDANLELTLKRLAQASRQNGDYGDGMAYLQRAIDIAGKISMVDPDLQTESNELCKYCRVIDPSKLGKDAEKLIRDNKATIIVVKDKDEGNFIVTVTIPNRIENTTGDDKVDQIAMEKCVTLNLFESPDGSVAASNIKGFKIHVVEKKMWVNLLGVKFGKTTENGGHEAAITAGKMGVTKTVNQTIDANMYQPIAAFVDETKLFGTPTDIATTTTPATSTSPTASTSTTTSTSSTSSTGSTSATTPASTSTTTSAGDLNVPTTNGSATTTNGSATTTNGSATTTNGSATTTNGSATTTNGSTTTTNGSATTTNGSATTTNGSATTTNGSSTASTTSRSVTPATSATPSTSSPSTTGSTNGDASTQNSPTIETTTVIDFSEQKKKEEAPKVEEPKQQSSTSVQKEANGSSTATSSVKRHDDDDDDDDDDKDKDKKKRDRDDD